MVDFQSRDRKRGLDDDEETEEQPESEPDTGTEESAIETGEAEDDPFTREETDEDHATTPPETPGIAVVTVSSSRTLAEDAAGDAIVAILEPTGEIVTRELVADDFDGVQRTVDALADREDVDVIITTGGTGVSPDDVTPEALRPLFDKHLPGFGELFRLLSHDEIGTRVVATRATAGMIDDTLVFILPGSENAARLGAEGIIAEELDHLIAQAYGE